MFFRYLFACDVVCKGICAGDYIRMHPWRFTLSLLSSYYASSVRVVYVFCVANYEEWCLHRVWQGNGKIESKMRLLPCLSLIREPSICVIIARRFLSVSTWHSRGVRISPIPLKFSRFLKSKADNFEVRVAQVTFS